MSAFPFKSLGELAANETGSVAIGPFGSRMKAEVYVDTGVPVIRGTNISANRSLKGDWVYVTPEFAKGIPNCIATTGDLVFPHRGSIGAVALIGENDGMLVISSSMMKFRPDPKKANSTYLYYFFRSVAGRNEILQYSSSVGTPGIGQPLTSLRRFLVPIPDVRIQTEIANVLSALDDKIELNRRMNETLEGMAQAIFKDWFVDFGPVRRKQEARSGSAATGNSKSQGVSDPVKIMGGLVDDPARAADLAALFPDSFADDDLPVGWEEETVIEQANWINGAAYKNMHFSDASDALPVVKITELKAGISKNTKHTNTELGDKYRIVDGELLFSWSGNPDTSIDTFIWTEGDAWLNQHIFAVRNNGRRTQNFLYTMLRWLKPEFAEIARNKQTTGLGHVTRADLKWMRICVATDDICDAFEDIVEPLLSRIKSNLFESQTLAQTRDYLLPKLMSGQIRAGDVAAETKEQPKPSNVVTFDPDLFGKPTPNQSQEQERDAVIVSAIVRGFGDNGTSIVGNRRYQKGCYFVRRRLELSVQDFLRKAAGPYNHELKYDGGYKIALERQYIKQGRRKGYDGNIPASRISEIDDLIEQYDLKDAIDWVIRHFKDKNTDTLGAFATIDKIMIEFKKKGVAASPEAIRTALARDPEWQHKLSQPEFKPAAIAQAIAELETLFGEAS